MLTRRLSFFLEWLSASLLGKILMAFMAFVIVSAAAGVYAHFFIEDFDSFNGDGLSDAIWWAFLHMSDTGYLGDNEGQAQRTLAVIITLVGALIVLVFLIAFLSSAIHTAFDQLELTNRPINERNHLVCIGWNDRMPELMGRLVDSRMRLAARFDDRTPDTIAVLAPRRLRERRDELLARLHDHCSFLTPRMLFGDPLTPGAFELVSAHDARVVLIPARSRLEVDPNIADVDNIKVGLSLQKTAHRINPRQTVTIEFHSARNLQAAKRVLPHNYNLMSSDQLAARIIRMSLTHPRLGTVLNRLFGGVGDEHGGLYMVKDKRLTGVRFDRLLWQFESAVPIGLMRMVDGNPQIRMSPPPDRVVEAEEEVVVVGRDLSSARKLADHGRLETPIDVVDFTLEPAERAAQRVLAIGWNHRIVALIDEMRLRDGEDVAFASLSALPIEQRERQLRVSHRTSDDIVLYEGSPSDPEDLNHAIESFKPDAIVVLSSEVVGNPRSADAQALICHLHLDAMVGDGGVPIVVELFYPADAADFSTRPTTDILVTDGLIAYLLSQIALRPEVEDVYGELLGERGATLDIVSISESRHEKITFGQAYDAFLRQGAVLIGYIEPDGDPRLIPADNERIETTSPLVVIRRASDSVASEAEAREVMPA